MRTAIDTNALIYLLDPEKVPPHLTQKMKGLLEDIVRSRGLLIIPAPVMSEYLANAGAAAKDLLEKLKKNRFVQIASFDEVAATEAALMMSKAKAAGNKKLPLPNDANWQKIKVDRQVVAIAKVRADRIISDDVDIEKHAKAAGVPYLKADDLPLPDWAKQMTFDESLSKPPTKVSRASLRAVPPTDPAAGAAASEQ